MTERISTARRSSSPGAPASSAATSSATSSGAIPGVRVINLDKLTYAGNLENLRDVEADPRYEFVHGDIRDRDLVARLFPRVQGVVHFAAETHVDRSIVDAGRVRPDRRPRELRPVRGPARRRRTSTFFVHVSTDEVYGSRDEGFFRETDPVDPVLALRRQQGRGRPPGLRLPRDLRPADRHRPAEQQLRPVPVPGEVHPAVRDQRPRREDRSRSTGRGPTSATGSTSRTTAGRSSSRPAGARRARPTTSARATRRRNIEVAGRICDLLGKPREPDQARPRPPRPRPPLRRRLRRRSAPSAGRRRRRSRPASRPPSAGTRAIAPGGRPSRTAPANSRPSTSIITRTAAETAPGA